MRKKLGTLFMVLGLLLVLGAVLLILNNQQEDQRAGEYSRNLMPELQKQIQITQETASGDMQAEILENIPAEFLDPEDLIMTEKVINGYAYVGYLEIPDLGLELPVMSGWDSRRLQISPCRYTGTVRGEDIVIMAHNYSTHFGQIPKLSEGAQVRFVDMDGTQWNYRVAAIDVLAADAVEEMTAGEYDLTLFTCAVNRTHRVTVRCDRTEE